MIPPHLVTVPRLLPMCTLHGDQQYACAVHQGVYCYNNTIIPLEFTPFVNLYAGSMATRPFKSIKYTRVDDRHRELAGRTGNLAIFTVGKTGSGKTQLVRDVLGPTAPVRPKSSSGMRPGTLETKEYKFKVGDVNVTLYDTRGMWDASAADHESKTAEIVTELTNTSNDKRNGLLIVCIEMHERLDYNTTKMLSLIHETCGSNIWRFTVIALTKADKYPAGDWLLEKRWYQRSGPILSSKFLSYLQKARSYVKEIFTETENVSSECVIGMSEDEFDRLNIPIVPTSTLNSEEVPDAIDKMATVGYEKWLDTFLAHCCARETGLSIISIHSGRCSYLSKFYCLPEDVDKEEYEKILEQIKGQVSYGACFVTWKLYWHIYYKDRYDAKPRFMYNTSTVMDSLEGHEPT